MHRQSELPRGAAGCAVACPDSRANLQFRLVEVTVALALAVSVAELRAPSRRSAQVARARQSAMYLAHTVCGLSYSEVARACGRDRTTVAHACRAIEERRDDPAVDTAMLELETRLGGLIVAGVAGNPPCRR